MPPPASGTRAAVMVIKDDGLRKKLWNASTASCEAHRPYFLDCRTKAECVHMLAGVANRGEVYGTLAQFEQGSEQSHEYHSQRTKAGAGGLTQYQLRCLRTLIKADPDLQYSDYVQQLDDSFNIRATLTQARCALRPLPVFSCPPPALARSLRQRAACSS